MSRFEIVIWYWFMRKRVPCCGYLPCHDLMLIVMWMLEFRDVDVGERVFRSWCGFRVTIENRDVGNRSCASVFRALYICCVTI